jgi:hypothetical protein
MKKLRLRQWVIDTLGVLLLYAIEIVGIILLNWRLS